MNDIRYIRATQDAFDAAVKRSNLSPMANKILKIDSDRRALQVEIQDMQSRRNIASKDIGSLKAKGGDADDLIAEGNDIKTKLPALEASE